MTETATPELTPEERAAAMEWAHQIMVPVDGLLAQYADSAVLTDAELAARLLLEQARELEKLRNSAAFADDTYRRRGLDLTDLRIERDAYKARAEAAETHRQFLWDLLDNIDTLEDATKGDREAFYNATHRQHQRRWEISSSDGYTVTWKAGAAAGTPPVEVE